MAGGTFLGFTDVVARLGEVTGRRRLRAVTVPAGMMLPPRCWAGTQAYM